jgi:hypothetical protein
MMFLIDGVSVSLIISGVRATRTQLDDDSLGVVLSSLTRENKVVSGAYAWTFR